jgi:hypothetical protein
MLGRTNHGLNQEGILPTIALAKDLVVWYTNLYSLYSKYYALVLSITNTYYFYIRR